MARHNRFAWWAVIMMAGLSLAGCAATDGAKGDFTRSTVDIGIVASEVERTAQFYTEALGFTEVAGFDVSAEKAGGAGLTDNRAFHVRVFVLADEPTATKIKLMEFPDAPGKKLDNRFIHSSLGYSYITIFVSDTRAALERAKKAGVLPVKEPYPIGGGRYLTLVRDPDGNIIELVGPQK